MAAAGSAASGAAGSAWRAPGVGVTGVGVGAGGVGGGGCEVLGGGRCGAVPAVVGRGLGLLASSASDADLRRVWRLGRAGRRG